MRVRATVLSVVALALLGLAGNAQAATTAPGGTLYVQQASGGTLLKHGSHWRLVLSKPWSRTTYFNDRPSRRGGSLSLRDFVSFWPKTFGGVAPNVALEIAGGPPARDVALLQLSRPRLDAARGTLTFVARPLDTSSDVALRQFDRRADHVSGRFGRASLFIDDGEEGSVLTFTVRGLPAETNNELQSARAGLELPQNHFLFAPAASLLAESKGLVFGVAEQSIQVACGPAVNGIAACNATVRIRVAASPGQPLSVLFSPPEGGQGAYSASWAGGPTVALTESNSDYSLPPAP